MALKGPAQFEAVFSAGRPVTRGPLRAYFRANGLGQLRLGTALPRKQFPRAVDRNRLRRVLRESVRSHGATLQGLDLVVTGRRPLDELANAELFELLEDIWRRIDQARG